MRPWIQRSLLLLAGVLAGGAANLVLRIPQPVQAVVGDLELVMPAEADEPVVLAQVDAAWQQKAPWGAPPPPPEPVIEAAPEPPPPQLLGVVRSGRSYRAVFMIEGAGQLILAPGARLPGGGQVLSVAGLRVSWRDAKGQRHTRQVFDTYQEAVEP